MIATRNSSVALLLLAAISSQCHAGLRNGVANKVKRKLNEDNNKNLFKEDEGFWTRYVEEVSESIPTPRPTPFPFPGPTPQPTPSPTPPPTPLLTQPPTPTFTSPPTPQPTPSPTPPPTPQPTPQPTPPPGACGGSAEIECVTADGTACTELESPDSTCSVGSSVDSISFVVEFCTCEESKNSQGGECTDEGGDLPGPDATVRFTCTDPDNNLLFSQNVKEGGLVSLQAEQEDAPVPEMVTCSLFTESGERLQTVVIDTSGSVDLFLGDKFGSLTLVSCGDSDCLVDVTYTYTTCNIGDTNLSVTKFERDREGDMIDLLPQINPEIPPDSCETASESETISLCVEDGFFTTIVMEDSTGSCGAEEDYFFELQPETPPPEPEQPETPPPEPETAPPDAIPPPIDCSVDVVVACKTEDGVECNEVIPPADCSPLEVCYEYELSNVGTSDMDITTLERTRNDETLSLMDQLETTTLAPGDSTTIVEKEMVDFCVGAEHCTDVIATADPPNGNACADKAQYCVTTSWLPLSPPPTPIPSDSPTPEVCEFQMEIECPNCNATPPPVEQCAGRPLAMGWIYSGGGCENSWNVQEEKFICEDFNGGPPTELGEKSFIVVTDADGSMTYTREYVEVGSMYQMNSGGERFSADSLITVYKNNNTGDLANLLQSVQYHSSCSSTLFLKNRFGAHILVQWTNEEQGTISCFANQTFNIEVDIPIDFEGGPATVTSLTVASNVDPFFFNLTSEVAGTEVNAGDTFQTTVAVPIDLSEKREYNMLVTLSAETAGGTTCTAVDLVSFEAGYPLPPIFPTFAPTGPPDEI